MEEDKKGIRKQKSSILTPVKDPSKELEGKPPWRLSIPAKMSETGKRVRKFYWSFQAAREAAKAYKQKHEERKAGLESLSIAQTQEAISAIELLEGTGVSLLESARIIAKAAKEFGSDAGKIEQALIKGSKILEAENYSPSFSDVAKEMLYVKEAVKKRRPRTLEQLRYMIKRIEKSCPDFCSSPIGSLTGDDCRQAIRKSFPIPIQADKARVTLSGVWSLAVKRGWAASNITKQIDALTHEEKEIHALSPLEIKSLLVSCNDTLAECLAPIAIMAFGGIRPEEMTRIDWSDISFEHKVVTVRTRASKTGGARHVTMNDTMRSWLSIIPERSRVGSICPRGWRYLWEQVRARAGWSTENPWVKDSLRHTFATYHAKKHGDFSLLQMEMGHQSSDLLRTRYMNMAGITKQMTKDFWALKPS